MCVRIGSIRGNQLGGWYSYRTSRAALNQVTKMFDVYLRLGVWKSMCVGMHPEMMETRLGRGEFRRG